MIVIPENVIYNQLEVLISNVWENHKTVVALGAVTDANEETSGFTVVTTQQGAVGVAEITTIATVADVSGSLGGMYFTLNTPSSEWYFWFNTGSSTKPVVSDKIAVVVNIDEDDDAETVATKLNDVINMYPLWFTSTVDTDELTITCVETDARRRGLLYAMFGSNQLDRLNYYDQMVSMLEDRVNAQSRRFGLYIGWNPNRTTNPSVSIMLPNEEHSPNRVSTTTSVKTLNYQSEKTEEKTHSYATTYDLLITSDNENEVVIIYHFLKSLIAIGDMQFQTKGLQNMSITGRDITTDFDLMPRLVYHRTVGLTFHYDNSLPSFESFVNATSVIVNGGLTVNINPVTNYVTIINGAGRVLRIVELGGVADLGYILFTDSDGQQYNVPVGDNVTATSCGTPPPVDIEVNGIDIGAPVASGGTHNQVIRNSDGTSVGTAANPSIVANANLSINGVNEDVLKPEVDFLLLVKLDGVQSGTYDSGTKTVNVASTSKSVVLSISDANPSYGDVVTLTQTPSFAATEYTFSVPLCDGNFRRITQASNTYDWTVEVVGNHTVYGGCNDGSGTAYDADGIDVVVPVDIMGVSTPFLCASLVLLNPNYANALLLVERDSDNAQKAFYPNGDGKWANDSEDGSGTSAATWLSGTTGYLAALYDQSGNGRNGEQVTFNAMPKIFESGNVLVDGDGIPYADFDGSTDGFEFPDLGGEARMDFYIVQKINDTAFILLTDGGRYAFVGQASTATTVQNLWNTTALRIDGDVKNWSSRQDVLDAISTNQKQILESRDAELTAWSTFRLYNYAGWYTIANFYGIVTTDYDSVNERLAINSVLRNKLNTP